MRSKLTRRKCFCAISSALKPSREECARPRKARAVSSKLCSPSDSRLTPATVRSAKRAASTELGLASSVISTSADGLQWPQAASISAATIAGSISDGVPPPKKTEVSVRPGSSRASWDRSARRASRHSSWSMDERTWLLKSQ